jgi:Ca2+/Na+ antiporter
MNFFVGYAALLSYRYWINPRPVPLGPSLVGSIVAFFGWFVLASVVLFLVARHFKRPNRLLSDAIRRFARLMLVTAGLGYMFLFFAYEQVPILGMRLWFLLLFVLFSVWLVRAIMFVVRDYPHLHQQENERTRFERYLPKAK